MGLDTVELVMAFEEALGYEIPNDQAERMRTVRDVVDYTATRKPLQPSTRCSTRRTYFQLKRAIGMTVSPKPSIGLSTRMERFADRETWPALWSSIRLCAGEEHWPHAVGWTGRWRDEPQTVGELALYVNAQLPRTPHPEGVPWTRDEIIQTIRQVLHEEQGIWRAYLDDSFVDDLRLD